MKIAFTAKGNTWESLIDFKFSRADIFLIYDEATQQLESITNHETQIMGSNISSKIAKKIIALNLELIITGDGAGSKILNILKNTPIKIYTGANNMTISEAYKAFKNNKLKLQ